MVVMGRPTMAAASAMALVMAACLFGSGAAVPEQVHLSVTAEADEVVVFWMTQQLPKTSTVQYGLGRWWLNLTATSSDVEQYYYQGVRMREGYTSGYIHEVILRGLRQEDYPVTYFYRCGDPQDGWSEVRTFRTRPKNPDVPVLIAATADSDAGQQDIEPCRNLDRCVPITKTKEVMQMLQNRSETIQPVDLFLNIGDLSYADGHQPYWDDYGHLVENFTSVVPIVTAVGNHELENRKTYDTWLHRWRHAEPEEGDPFWFSFDYGPIHFVMLSTEHETSRQVQWLEEDLKQADDPEQRLRVPWIIVGGHHPMFNAGKYSMGEWNIEKFSSLFAKHRVNLYLCGHCHNYERTKPISQWDVTDWGDGHPDAPYLQEVLPPTPQQVKEDFYCGWQECNGQVNGDSWCNKFGPNCQKCGGVWCERGPGKGLVPDFDPDNWGTIHMIIGTGGRRGDQCKALEWTHNKPYSNRGAAFFAADRSSLTMQYVDIEGDVIDEFKICARRNCAPAPELPGVFPVGPAPPPPPPSLPPLPPTTSGPAAQGSPPVLPSPAASAVVAAPKGQTKTTPVVKAEVPSPSPAPPLARSPSPPQALQTPEALQREVPGSRTSNANEDDEGLPGYLEKNDPVEAAEDCPFGIVKINLDDAGSSSGLSCTAQTRDEQQSANGSSTTTTTKGDASGDGDGNGGYRADPAVPHPDADWGSGLPPGGYESVAALQAAIQKAAKEEESKQLVKVLVVAVPLAVAVVLILGILIWVIVVCMRKSQPQAAPPAGHQVLSPPLQQQQPAAGIVASGSGTAQGYGKGGKATEIGESSSQNVQVFTHVKEAHQMA